jgi:hypothetical protein
MGAENVAFVQNNVDGVCKTKRVVKINVTIAVSTPLMLTNIMISIPCDINFRFIFDDVLFIRILDERYANFLTMSNNANFIVLYA